MAGLTAVERRMDETLADVLRRLGDVPPERVLMRPWPGTATEKDVIRLLEGPRKRICELVDGILVEKPMGWREGFFAGVMLHCLWSYLERKDLGVAAGADSPIRLRLGLVRIPDVCFVSWKRLGGSEVPEDPISKVVPELAIEVLSRSNTPLEIELKLREYFRAGVLLVWVLDPRTQSAGVYTSPIRRQRIGPDGALDGGRVLPGFRLVLKDLFARVRRRKPRFDQ